MSTQLILVADERGFTVQFSTTHHTQAGALAEAGELSTTEQAPVAGALKSQVPG